MYELRSLRHGQRPVTGQDNRRAVEDFFNHALHDTPETSHDPPRPESVLVEVNALVERRPVSSILERAGLRRNLENALRGAISRVSVRTPEVRRPDPTSSANSRVLSGGE